MGDLSYLVNYSIFALIKQSDFNHDTKYSWYYSILLDGIIIIVQMCIVNLDFYVYIMNDENEFWYILIYNPSITDKMAQAFESLKALTSGEYFLLNPETRIHFISPFHFVAAKVKNHKSTHLIIGFRN